jgi:hypothetical protein
LTRRYTNASLRWVGVPVLVLIAMAPPRAQVASSSDLRISVTVARSCTVSTALAATSGPEPDSLVSVRCAEGATSANPQVSVVEEAAPRLEQQGPVADSDAPADGGIRLVIINF